MQQSKRNKAIEAEKRERVGVANKNLEIKIVLQLGNRRPCNKGSQQVNERFVKFAGVNN